VKGISKNSAEDQIWESQELKKEKRYKPKGYIIYSTK
jgi:hypothetical protein